MSEQEKYSGLLELTKSNVEANQYFDSLPNYVKEMINQRAQNVNSLDSLRDYAENLLRGDN